MHTKTKISIVTVCYNAIASIEETILSVINQDYPDTEYIIIDGGSTDGTVDIIRKYEHRIAKWISEPDHGIYDAMNKGIDNASGDYINFMNAGDRFYDRTVLSRVCETASDEDVIYGDAVMVTEYCAFTQQPQPLSQFVRTLPFCHQAAFAKSSLMRKFRFDTSFRSAADYHFMYTLWHDGHSFGYVPSPIAIFDARAGFSAKNKKIVLKEIARVNGRDQRFCGRLSVRLQYADFYCRSLLKRMLPKKLVKNISIHHVKQGGGSVQQ